MTGEPRSKHRQEFIAVLNFVMLMGGMLACVLAAQSSRSGSVGLMRAAIVSGIIAAIALVCMAKLVFNAAHDCRRGIERGSAIVAGRFNIWFGAVAAVGGIIWSLLAHGYGEAPVLYYAMIAWGIIQILSGWANLAEPNG